MIKRFMQGGGAVFALVFLWKIAIVLVSAQPVPANDAFFYDGAVVNFLLHGKYVNPSLALALPTSGTKVFCLYPPLYQAVLLPWMAVFGTSAISAISFHLLLFGVFLLILLAIFKRLAVPAWCGGIAGAFLFNLTFHDRPDSLAQVLGMLAVYCWIRSRPAPSADAPSTKSNLWLWGTALCVFLCFTTSLQLGAIYLGVIWVGALASVLWARDSFPFAPIAVMTALPPLAIAAVAHFFPELWAGFLEHAHQTPSLKGWRTPGFDDLLKVARTAPGIFAVAILLPAQMFCYRNTKTQDDSHGLIVRLQIVTIAALAGAFAVIGAGLFLLTPNIVGIAGYFQPLIVGGYFAWLVVRSATPPRLRQQTILFLGLGALRLDSRHRDVHLGRRVRHGHGLSRFHAAH